MRRPLALGLVGLAFVLSLAFAYFTWACGVRSVSEGCFSTEECEAESVCASALHPLSLPLTGVSLLGLVLAWRGASFPLMLAGVLTSAVGTIFGFSAGLYGVGAGLLITLAGSALCGWPWTRVGAPIAAVLSLALGIAAATADAHGLFYLGVLAPPLAWLGLWAWEADRRA